MYKKVTYITDYFNVVLDILNLNRVKSNHKIIAYLQNLRCHRNKNIKCNIQKSSTPSHINEVTQCSEILLSIDVISSS